MAQPRRLARSSIERPQRAPPRSGLMRDMAHRAHGLWLRSVGARGGSLSRLVPDIVAASEQLESLSDAGFKDHMARLHERLLREASAPDALIAAFAAAREASRRALGMRHFESQILGGLTIYHGAVAEMRTGEGKTLTAILPAAAAALAGVPVHVMTVNDYLAERDAEEMAPVYALLGLSVGCVVQETPRELRRELYGRDVVYCTNKEAVFDYMRDGLLLHSSSHPLLLHAQRLKGGEAVDQNLNMRGLHFAIVDEADSVMLDEARTPLVISGEGHANRQETEVYGQALALARRLEEGVHYTVQKLSRRLELTPAGEWAILDLTEGLGPAWTGRLRRMELARSGLVALHLFDRDAHYLVRDDKVTIIDENTGRPMPDRTWEQGLHQLIELKEAVTPTYSHETLARLSFQRFFRLYHHVGGMTGTAQEVTGELWLSYGLPVRRIPTHRPSRLRDEGAKILSTTEEKWLCVAARAAQLQEQGRSLLIGTRTVGASEDLSAVLSAHGLEHKVLNARQDQGEAEIVSRAGEAGVITIATNMAGRGTDIKLGPGVEDSGGLHVIVTELHESGRLDRQLIGRSARQGDPGSFEIIASLQDVILANNAPRLAALLGRMREGRGRTRLALALMRLQQWRAGRLFASRRADLLKADEQEASSLSFAGRYA
jgi:preprotein translocase subunit SecA